MDHPVAGHPPHGFGPHRFGLLPRTHLLPAVPPDGLKRRAGI